METKCSYLIVLVPGPQVEHFAPEGYFLLPQGQTTPRALTGRGLEDTAQPASLFGGLSAFTAKHEGLASAKPQGILEEMQPAGDGCVCSEDELDGPRDDPQTASVSQTDTLQPKIQKSHQLKKHLRKGKKKSPQKKQASLESLQILNPGTRRGCFLFPQYKSPRLPFLLLIPAFPHRGCQRQFKAPQQPGQNQPWLPLEHGQRAIPESPTPGAGGCRALPWSRPQALRLAPGGTSGGGEIDSFSLSILLLVYF